MRRNTTTERLCPACEGAGEVTRNDTNPHGFGPDPQCDEVTTCFECVGGWIRWRERDVLEALAYCRTYGPDFTNYRQRRAEAFARVRLPA